MLPQSAARSAPEACLSLLRSRLRQGLKVTPLCIAIIGWLCDVSVNPYVTEIRHNPDDQVWLRLSDEFALEPLCSSVEFLQQVRIICQAVGMTEGQTRATVAWAQGKLG